MNWLLVILILCYPGLAIKPEWYSRLRSADVRGHYMDSRGRIGWYNPETWEIHIVYSYEQGGRPMLRRLSHEAHHYLARKAKLGDWEKFADLTMKLARRDHCSAHQLKTIKGMIAYGGGYELHAELPWILEGKIPLELQMWYPWFVLEQKAKP